MSRWLGPSLVVLLACVSSPRAQPVTDAPAFGAPYRFTEATGSAVYAAACAGCHMPNGRGAEGAGAYPSLVQDPRLASGAYTLALVLRGHGAMPSFGRMLSDQQVADVVGFVRQSFGNAYADPPTAADVRAAR